VAAPVEAWQEWLDRHGPAALLFARQLTGNAADAQDALQDGFIRFWRHRQKAQDDAAFLFTCVRTAALDLRRSQKRRRDRERETMIMRSQAALFTNDPDNAECSAAIQQALIELPEAQRDVVFLKIWAGLTFAQMCQALGESMGTVSSRYRYAMEKLGALLSSEVDHG